MKILLTGSSGRVGRAIQFRLCQAHCVVGIDRHPASSTQHVGDMTNRDELLTAIDAMGGCDAVIHTAALHAPHVSTQNEAAFDAINVKATRQLIETMREAGIPRLVFTSTTALYGQANMAPDQAVWINEATPPAPRTVYHRSKLMAEAILQEAASAKLTIRVLRMSRCFPEPAPIMAVYRLHRAIDARDVAKAHELALLHEGKPYEMFVISGVTPFTKEDLTALKHDAPSVLRDRCPALVTEYDYRGWALPSSIDRVYDSQKAQAALNWIPGYGFEAVLAMLDDNNNETLPPEAAGSVHQE